MEESASVIQRSFRKKRNLRDTVLLHQKEQRKQGEETGDETEHSEETEEEEEGEEAEPADGSNLFTLIILAAVGVGTILYKVLSSLMQDVGVGVTDAVPLPWQMSGPQATALTPQVPLPP